MLEALFWAHIQILVPTLFLSLLEGNSHSYSYNRMPQPTPTNDTGLGQQKQKKNQQQHQENEADYTDTHPYRILTVGDGDLTLSLALVRAYGNRSSLCYNKDNHSNNDLELTASTLIANEKELIRTYPHTAPDVLHELQASETRTTILTGDCDHHHSNHHSNKEEPNTTRTPTSTTTTSRVEILYNVDATQLHHQFTSAATQQQQVPPSPRKWNAILFHHPHLGLFETEQEQSIQHERLLAHYLWSASQCCKEVVMDDDDDNNALSSRGNAVGRGDLQQKQSFTTSPQRCRRTGGGGIVHLCLCGTQAKTWKLQETCDRLGLQLVAQEPTTRPFHLAVLDQPQWNVAVPPPRPPITTTTTHSEESNRRHLRRARYGKHCNNRHWLVKYGYQHQRTHGELLRRYHSRVNLEGSMHYIIVVRPKQKRDNDDNVWPTTEWSEISNCNQSSSDGDGCSVVIHRFRCNICLATFETLEELRSHLRHPATPQPAPPSPQAATTTMTTTTSLSPTQCEEEQEQEDRGTKSCSNTSSSRKKTLPGPVETVVDSAAPASAADTSSSQRLRKYVQIQFSKSKNQAHRLITHGHVRIDQQVITDTARLVPPDAVVSLLSTAADAALSLVSAKAIEPHGSRTNTTTTSAIATTATTTQEPSDQPSTAISTQAHTNPLGGIQIEILDTWPLLFSPSSSSSSSSRTTLTPPQKMINAVVVWKPVGLRTLGQFTDSASTLEARVSQQLSSMSSTSQQPKDNPNNRLYSWTRLDTGCSGLCILAPQPPPILLSSPPVLSSSDPPWNFELKHSFTLLVHGSVPDDWMHGHVLEFPLQQRRWRKKRPRSGQEEDEHLQQEPHPVSARQLASESTKDDLDVNDAFATNGLEKAESLNGHTHESQSNHPGSTTFEQDDTTTRSPPNQVHCEHAASPPVLVNGLDSTSAMTTLQVRIVLLEKTTDATVPALSTLCAETTRTVSGIATVITHGLRHHASKKTVTNDRKGDHGNDDDGDDEETTEEGYRVVGDRFSRHMDSQRLPRSMRYRLKNKLCMACTSVEAYAKGRLGIEPQRGHLQSPAQRFKYSRPIPDKWKALFWQEFLLKGST